MRINLIFLALITLSLQAMEPSQSITIQLQDGACSLSDSKHKLLCHLSQTYADIAQDTEKELGNTQVITLNNIPKRSFLFIKKHLKQLDRLGNPTPENKDQKAFNKLKNYFNALSGHRRKSIKQIATYLDLPKTTYLRGGNIHINHCKDVIAIINQYIFNDHSEWPIIRTIAENLIAKSKETLERCLDSPLSCLALTSDNRLISCYWYGTIKIWDLETKKCIGTLKKFLGAHRGGIHSLALTSDNRLVSGSNEAIKIWNLETKKCIGTLKCIDTLSGHNRRFSCLALTSDNRLISGYDNATSDETIKIWDLETKKCIDTLQSYNDPICSLALTSDNRLISGSYNGTIMIWNLETKKCIGTLKNPYRISCMALTSDNRLILGSRDGTIKIWDLETKNCITTLDDHGNESRLSDRMSCLALTSDNRLISGSYNGTIMIWNLETEKCIGTLDDYWTTCLALTSDNRLISGSYNGTIVIWNLDKFKEVKERLSQLSICDVAILKIIQDKTQSKRQLKNLCVKATQLGASPILLELLEQRKAPTSSNCLIQ